MKTLWFWMFIVHLCFDVTITLQIKNAILKDCISAGKDKTQKNESTCYHLRRQKYMQNIAEYECSKDGGRLAIVSDDETWEEIITRILKPFNESVWLGYCFQPYTDKLYPAVDLSKFSYVLDRYNDQVYDRTCFISDPINQWGWIKMYYREEISSLCEFKVKSCDLRDLKIPNADFEDFLFSTTTPAYVGHNEKVNVQCHEDFSLLGLSPVTCFNGEWIDIPVCHRGCLPPGERENAKIINSKAYYNENEEAFFICDETYFFGKVKMTLVRHFHVQCLTSGKWSDDNHPKCCLPISSLDVNFIEIEGQELITLKCNLLGSTSSTIKWMKDVDVKMNEKFQIQSDGSLVIKSPDKNDEGIYFCMNSTDSADIEFTVYELMVKPEPCLPLAEVEVKAEMEGTALILQCPEKPDKVRWFKDGHLYRSGGDRLILPNGNLVFRQLHYLDNGIYSCNNCKNTKYDVATILLTNSICRYQSNIIAKNKTPWLVSFWDTNRPYGAICYGVVISSSWIMTSAWCLRQYTCPSSNPFGRQTFCLSKDNLNNLQVQFLYNVNGTEFFSVKKIEIHSKYNEWNNDYNIGLIQLKNEIRFEQDSVLPACLFAVSCEDLLDDAKGMVAGLGSLIKSSPVKETVEEMMVVSPKECSKSAEMPFTNGTFCAKSLSEFFSGDSGSPFLVEKNGRHYVIGIFSWGQREIRTGEFDYFVNVGNYFDWIESVINEANSYL